MGVEDKTHKLIGVTNFIDEADLGQKIYTALGYTINVELTYFKHNDGNREIDLGILYIPNSQKICVSPKTYTGVNKTIIQSDVVYVRRNTSSVIANSEDLQELAYKILKKGKYEFSDRDKEIIERNKKFAKSSERLYQYLEGRYKFSSIGFSNKLNEIFSNQTDYNKLEFATLLGLDEDKIDAYFDGYAVPKLEHILRATEVFKLPMDFFFQPTINKRKPLWYSPMVAYCVIDKVIDKRNLFNIDYGNFFREVFIDMTKSIYRFYKWLNSNRIEKPTDEIELMFSDYDPLDDYVISLSDEELDKYKRHLSTQFYKLLQIARDGDTDGDRDGEYLYPEEKIVLSLIGYEDEFICRIINEAIKEIVVNDGKNIEIEYHFFYELKNLLKRGRSYNANAVKLELGKEEKFK